MSKPDDLFHLSEEVARLATIHSIPELTRIAEEMEALADDFPEELVKTTVDDIVQPTISLASGGMIVQGNLVANSISNNILKITP